MKTSSTNITEPKINKGFETEANHFEELKLIFGKTNVTEPKNSGGGADFVVTVDDKVITFESKTSNTDIFDAGCISAYANGMIFKASAFLSNTHINQVERDIQSNFKQVVDYTAAANTNMIPHVVEKSIYNQIKADKKLIQISSNIPLSNIIEESFIQSKNRFVKANYIIIDDLIYCVSEKPELDPLNLLQYGSVTLKDEHINKYTIRTARGSTRNDKVSVALRLQYQLQRKLPKTNVRLRDLK